MTKRYEAIDGLRTFASFGIVFMHVRAKGGYAISGFMYDSVIRSFTDFVFLFMVISAFSMCCGYYEKVMKGGISFPEFYRKRFQKILPFFAMLVMIDVIISRSTNSIYEAFADLTLMFGFLPDAGKIEVIGVGWFLGLVFIFYLIFPFFCVLINTRKRAWAAFIVSIIYNFVCSNYFGVGRKNILYSGCFFLLGGLIYLYRDKLEKIAVKYRWLIITALVGAAGFYYTLSSSAYTSLVLSGLMLIYALRESRGKYSLLFNPVTRYLSSISMEIYLCHMVIFRVLEKLHLIHFFGYGWISYLCTSIATIIGAVIFSTVCKRLIEMLERKIIGTKRSNA